MCLKSCSSEVYFLDEICGNQLTINHLLVECKKYKYIQKKYYNEPDIKKLFGRISPYRILKFLQKINLLESLQKGKGERAKSFCLKGYRKYVLKKDQYGCFISKYLFLKTSPQ